jgi:hypothetical protein
VDFATPLADSVPQQYKQVVLASLVLVNSVPQQYKRVVFV